MPEALQFTDAEKDAFRKAYAPAGANDDQWLLFINECQRRALVPGVHVVFQLRSSKEYDKDLKKDVWAKKVTFITTINALRLIAVRDGHYEGHGPFVYYYGTEDGDLKESKIPLGKVPHAVSVEGYRRNWRVPLFATARYDAYVQKFGDDKKPTTMWATRGEEQLAKCCEALMLRTVAPEECAGLLINEELGNDGVVDREEVTTPVAAVIPLPTVAPKVNQTASVIDEVQVVPQVPNIEPAIQLLVAESEKKREQETKQNDANAAAVSKPTQLAVPLQPGEFGDRQQFKPAPVSPTVQPLVTPPPSSATTTVGQNTGTVDTPATRKEYDDFLGRAAKLVRDKLPKAGMKDAEASNGVKNYLLKQSGKTGLKQISAVTFERLLKVLEDAAIPEDAAAIVQAQSK